ncbi:MAG: hypothetical protein CVT89_02805 [Candidatus Altiarchaeales archaeon HGW-Altiarchaeales-2]|nr:MAG: hypothetical protein CVT89_02805 [Candidatus Altiarchaeales archaeon HGW-Altiarchaeales-2]
MGNNNIDVLGKELLDFLSADSLKEAKKELYNLLKVEANNEEINVYYVVSLDNLRNILSEGIKCRTAVNTENNKATDLSGSEVQEKRNMSLKLAQNISQYETINKEIHSCINFFWNPLNDTLLAFQRNALRLVDSDGDTYGIVCILEMRLNDFFESGKIYWTTSRKNLTSDKYASFVYKNYKNFEWDEIFSIPKDNEDDKDEKNKFRSSEFVVFYGDSENIGGNSYSIPPKFIKRILVPKEHKQKVQEKLSLFQIPIVPLEKFWHPEDLLHYEDRMIFNLDKLKTKVSIQKFCELINTFSKINDRIILSKPIKDFYDKNRIAYTAYGNHGVGHTTRVMFWAYILSYLSNVDRETKLFNAIEYAAFIHDLCRESDKEDKEHGKIAIEKYENLLKSNIHDDNLLDSCKNAVSNHCKDDDECLSKDLVWRILKDANSLDRGRFGHPITKNTLKSSKGCNVEYLRTNVILNDESLKNNLSWLAHWIANITIYTKWSDNTFTDFKNQIVMSLKTYLDFKIYKDNENYKQIAEEMLKYLK